MTMHFVDFVAFAAAKLLSYEAMINRETRRRSARGDLELAVDRAQVRVNGVRAEDQPLGHLCIGQPLGYQTQHLDLARRQAGWIFGYDDRMSSA
jgi:hypothetical protein